MYGAGRGLAAALAAEAPDFLGAAFLAAALAAAFGLAATFLADVALDFFFIFMGRTVQREPPTVK